MADVRLTMPRAMTVRSRGSLRVPGRVLCDGPDRCRVEMQLRGGRRVLHRAVERVAAGRSAALTLRLKPAVRRTLRRLGRADLFISATSGSDSAERRVRVTVR